MLINELFKKVVAVLESDYSSYAIAKYVGDASAHNINNLRNRKSRIEDIKFGKLKKMEEFYEEMVKVKIDINEVTNDYIKFECKVCGKEQAIVSDHDHVQEMAFEIEKGVNPFAEGWEDGIGNTIVCDCELTDVKFYIDTPRGFANDRVLYATKDLKAIEILDKKETTIEVTEEEAKRQFYRRDEYAVSPAIEYSDIIKLSSEWDDYVAQMVEDAAYRFKVQYK